MDLKAPSAPSSSPSLAKLINLASFNVSISSCDDPGDYDRPRALSMLQKLLKLREEETATIARSTHGQFLTENLSAYQTYRDHVLEEARAEKQRKGREYRARKKAERENEMQKEMGKELYEANSSQLSEQSESEREIGVSGELMPPPPGRPKRNKRKRIEFETEEPPLKRAKTEKKKPPKIESIDPLAEFSLSEKNCAEPECTQTAVALSAFCHAHILSDPDQKLFVPCDFEVEWRKEKCGYPVLRNSVRLCPVHSEVASSRAMAAKISDAKTVAREKAAARSTAPPPPQISSKLPLMSPISPPIAVPAPSDVVGRLPGPESTRAATYPASSSEVANIFSDAQIPGISASHQSPLLTPTKHVTHIQPQSQHAVALIPGYQLNSATAMAHTYTQHPQSQYVRPPNFSGAMFPNQSHATSPQTSRQSAFATPALGPTVPPVGFPTMFPQQTTVGRSGAIPPPSFPNAMPTSSAGFQASPTRGSFAPFNAPPQPFGATLDMGKLIAMQQQQSQLYRHQLERARGQGAPKKPNH